MLIKKYGKKIQTYASTFFLLNYDFCKLKYDLCHTYLSLPRK